MANAIWVWGVASVVGGRVLLRIEDHDRERSRSTFDAAIVDDLAWLGFAPDAGPFRQRVDPLPYLAAVERLRDMGRVYPCDCTRAAFTSWATIHGQPWRGPGCPGRCMERDLVETAELTLRVRLGPDDEPWDDRLLGRRSGPAAVGGDLPVRDRQGNWTYGLCVVVDDLRQAITDVVRGEDLATATPGQIRLARLLGRLEQPTFAHHALISKPGGAKLSKADGATGVRELRAAGWSAADVIGAAAAAIGLLAAPRRADAAGAADLVTRRLAAGPG